ncbi:MAG: metallophosphoesterase [Thermoprotei archaeon]
MKKLFPNSNINIYIIPGTPVIYVKDIDSIIFSDLHLGFEEAVARGLDYSSRESSYSVGMFIPKIQLKRIIETLDKVFSIVKPRKVIINGDVKHAFDRLLRQEREETKKLIEYLFNKGIREIVVIRGNHDNFIPIVLRDYGIDLVLKYEFVSGGKHVVITHGHLELDPSEADLFIIGHEHPSIRCMSVYRFPAFMIIPTTQSSQILVLPAIGPYHPGIQITTDNSSYLSPIIREYGVLDKSRVITWIDLGEFRGVLTEFSFEEELRKRDLLYIERYVISGREIAVLDFSSIEVALAICGSYV